MSDRDFDLPEDLEALLQRVCAERRVPVRRHDELRSLLLTAPERWPVCCRGKCDPCVDDQTRVAREVLSRCARPGSSSEHPAAHE